MSIAFTEVALATDIDGPDGPGQSEPNLVDRLDTGDAPHCIAAYSSGQIGHFPSSWCDCGDTGTKENEALCPARGTRPGLTGVVRNYVLYDAWWVWLGSSTPEVCKGSMYCVGGIDSDYSCNAKHCVQEAFGMSFNQDECPDDLSDAGITTLPVLAACDTASVTFRWTNLAGGAETYLNILIDMNQDGDWNDSFSCDSGDSNSCAYEWAVKNQPILRGASIPGSTGGYINTSPYFRVGPYPGESWLRISLSLSQVTDDFPWKGEVMSGGETEDYPVTIGGSTPVRRTTWGMIKSKY